MSEAAHAPGLPGSVAAVAIGEAGAPRRAGLPVPTAAAAGAFAALVSHGTASPADPARPHSEGSAPGLAVAIAAVQRSGEPPQQNSDAEGPPDQAVGPPAVEVEQTIVADNPKVEPPPSGEEDAAREPDEAPTPDNVPQTAVEPPPVTSATAPPGPAADEPAAQDDAVDTSPDDIGPVALGDPPDDDAAVPPTVNLTEPASQPDAPAISTTAATGPAPDGASPAPPPPPGDTAQPDAPVSPAGGVQAEAATSAQVPAAVPAAPEAPRPPPLRSGEAANRAPLRADPPGAAAPNAAAQPAEAKPEAATANTDTETEIAGRAAPYLARPAPAGGGVSAESFAHLLGNEVGERSGPLPALSQVTAEPPVFASPSETVQPVVRAALQPGSAFVVALPVRAIAVHMAQRLADGQHEFRIRLDPPELGRVDIRMDIARDGHLTAHLTADRPDTLDALQRDARALERALQTAGLDVDDGALNFELREQGHDQGGFAGTDRGEPGEADGDGETDIPATRRTISLNALDIRV